MSKIILHIDFNSYFASVEQQANPFLRGKAIAIGGKGKQSVDVTHAHTTNNRINLRSLQLERTVITTASKEAKALGIKTAMSSLEAKRMMPDLLIIPGDPHKYSEITNKFLKILRYHCDAVEQFSTDEAFTDVTIAAGDYFGATLLAQMIRDDIKKICGVACTASIGIGPNKLIAKLASECMKPSGLTVVMPKEVEQFVASQKLEDICGIGKRIKQRLNSMGVSTITELKNTSLPNLLKEFKSYGYFLYFAARGIGDDIVNPDEEEPKSIGHSYTYAHDLINETEIKKRILGLADRVAWRMRRDGYIGTRLSIYARYAHSGGAGAQKQFREPIEDGLTIYKNAWKILDGIRDQNVPIRLLGISVSGLLKTSMPSALFPKEKKMHHVLHALDSVQNKFGSGSWQRASTMGLIFKERTSGWHYDHES